MKKISIKGNIMYIVNIVFLIFAICLYGGFKAEAATLPRQYIISQDGQGDFVTIQEGVNAANDGDTLIIYPGIYVENVAVMGKAVNIIGIDKNYCILQCDTGSYRGAPLTIAAGKVSNMTIHGINSGIKQPELTQEQIDAINSSIVGDNWDRQKNYSGYAVHIDQNVLFGREMIFENCNIISENNHCVGMGSRGNSKIIFDNCSLSSLGLGSCFYMHDTTSLNLTGRTNLIMRNCELKSYLCPYVISLQSLLSRNTTYLTFQNVHVSTVAFVDKGGYLSQGMSPLTVPLSAEDMQNFILYNSTMTKNVNSFIDIDSIEILEDAGMMPQLGFTTCLSTPLIMSNKSGKVVNRMSRKDTNEYMLRIEKAQNTHNYTDVINHSLMEGINYLGEDTEDTIIQEINNVKRQPIAIYNYTNEAGNGWCGLINTYLTPDSFGNTLYEMNAVVSVQ